jgi:hypothetical protein
LLSIFCWILWKLLPSTAILPSNNAISYGLHFSKREELAQKKFVTREKYDIPKTDRFLRGFRRYPRVGIRSIGYYKKENINNFGMTIKSSEFTRLFSGSNPYIPSSTFGYIISATRLIYISFAHCVWPK